MAQQQQLVHRYSEDQLADQAKAVAAGLRLHQYYIEGSVSYDKTTSIETFTISVPALNCRFTGSAANVKAPDQPPTTEIVGSIKMVQDSITLGDQAFTCFANDDALYITFYTPAPVANIWLAASPVTGFNDGVTYPGRGTWAPITPQP